MTQYLGSNLLTTAPILQTPTAPSTAIFPMLPLPSRSHAPVHRVGCSRARKPNAELIDDQGNHCPTEHAMVWMVHAEMHHAPKYWKRSEGFLPECWLVGPGHELYPMRGAWRSSGHNPRICISQTFAMTELEGRPQPNCPRL